MKVATFAHNGRTGFGLVQNDGIVDCSTLVPGCTSLKMVIAGPGLNALAAFANRPVDLSLEQVTLLPPLPDPDKILCVGVNYGKHLAETGRPTTPHPMLFVRFANSQVGAGQPMLRPNESTMFDFEGELAVVIGKRGRRIAPEDALDHVAGYSCYNDGSLRDWQYHTTQFAPGKNFVGTGAFGPWLVSADEIGDPHALTLTTRLNGEPMQQAETSDLIFDIPALLAYCSTFTEIVPGDVIVSGTPGGVGSYREPPVWLKHGDVVEVEIAGIGILRNAVRDEAALA